MSSRPNSFSSTPMSSPRTLTNYELPGSPSFSNQSHLSFQSVSSSTSTVVSNSEDQKKSGSKKTGSSLVKMLGLKNTEKKLSKDLRKEDPSSTSQTHLLGTTSNVRDSYSQGQSNLSSSRPMSKEELEYLERKKRKFQSGPVSLSGGFGGGFSSFR